MKKIRTTALVLSLVATLALSAAPAKERQKQKPPSLRDRIVRLIQGLEEIVQPKPGPATP